MKRKDKIYLIIILIAGLIGALVYFGIVGEIKITEQEVGPFKVVYETHIGDYSKIGSVQNKIYYSLIADGINTTKGFGIYYDNPKDIAKEKLRSEGGVIIEEIDYSKISGLNGKYNIKDIPKANSVVATFPYRNKFSIILGVFRVYPKLNSFIEEKGYGNSPAMEIYDMENNKIIYVMEIK